MIMTVQFEYAVIHFLQSRQTQYHNLHSSRKHTNQHFMCMSVNRIFFKSIFNFWYYHYKQYFWNNLIAKSCMSWVMEITQNGKC